MKTYIQPIKSERDIGTIVGNSVVIAGKAGFNELDCHLISTAVSEACTNIVRYADRGICKIDRTDNGRGLSFVFEDDGPGIDNLDHFLIDGNSSDPTSLGLGFGVIMRATEEFNVDSTPDHGTVVRFKKYLPVLSSLIHYGVVSVPDPMHYVNGDDYLVKCFNGDSALFAVLDGMGQGKHANEICKLCKPIILDHYDETPNRIVERCHNHLKKKRSELGLAMGLLKVTPGSLSYSAVGDTFIKILPAGVHPFWSQDGIVGLFRLPKVKLQVENGYPQGTVIVMCTDGIRDRFSQRDISMSHHPREIAAEIYRMCRRSAGDATVMALKLGKPE